MISNQVLQSTLEGLKEISRKEFCVIDLEGKILASTYLDFSVVSADIQAFVGSQADSQIIKDHLYFKVFDDYQLEYVLVVHGDAEDTFTVGKLAAFQLQNLIVAYKERFDKDSFIKNLLLDNLLLVDIYNRAKKLHIAANKRRAVMILELPQDKEHNNYGEIVKGLFHSKNKDFITAVDEKSIIIVKELEDGEGYPELEKLSNTIMDSLGMERNSGIYMAYGTIINELKEVSRSYKEARMALDVGKIFFGDKDVIAYSSLGIGRLIYQLPIPLCKMFIKEIFENKSPDDFDEETLTTIDKFFENSLNVSETSRQLYIHRNTLVYRLDKLQKSTGLDLRVFEDAITFKIALMVVRYMKYMETLEF
ncbi:MAG: helix-turn-helix domain-containing protein [Eubacteriales bacterium]|nr:helix-turn-helix domain-containing protein [Eubacteriales bacterium]